MARNLSVLDRDEGVFLSVAMCYWAFVRRGLVIGGKSGLPRAGFIIPKGSSPYLTSLFHTTICLNV